MNLSLVTKYILTVLLSKKSYILISFLSSFSLAILLEKIYTHIEKQDGIVSLTTLFILVMLNGIFIVIDFITGIIVSRYEGGKIQSSKWGITVGKFFGLLLYFVLCAIILLLVTNNYFVLTMIYGPIILTLLKEYISIGENFERRFGKKTYMFSIIDKVFDILEMKFFKTLEKKEVCNNEKDTNLEYIGKDNSSETNIN